MPLTLWKKQSWRNIDTKCAIRLCWYSVSFSAKRYTAAKSIADVEYSNFQLHIGMQEYADHDLCRTQSNECNTTWSVSKCAIPEHMQHQG